MKYYCNPVNVNYRYQFNMDPQSGGKVEINREAADPSMICFEGKYYIFASMTLGVWVSVDLVRWENHKLPKELPLYDYAPDVRVMNGWVYFCASRREKNCDRYRTRDIVNGPYERIEGTFPFWDPNMFIDDDGRVYFYWGCSNTTPIWGTELDPETMNPIGETRALISGDPWNIGFERGGEDQFTSTGN
ncbi:MAG: family 43 glycosylhydrolase [Anaerolineaceae bacterium]|nr:family 43 glycosylhydrolase [Anaerolineaceae bacterium]